MVTFEEALVLHAARQRVRRIKPTCCRPWLWHGLEARAGERLLDLASCACCWLLTASTRSFRMIAMPGFTTDTLAGLPPRRPGEGLRRFSILVHLYSFLACTVWLVPILIIALPHPLGHCQVAWLATIMCLNWALAPFAVVSSVSVSEESHSWLGEVRLVLRSLFFSFPPRCPGDFMVAN